MKKILFLLACVLLAELFVCNYRHFESLGNRERTRRLSASEIELEEGYFHVGDNVYLIVGDALGIEIKEINETLSTACIDIRIIGSEEETAKPVTIHQWVTDESHKLYYGLPGREIWRNEKRSSYITYHLYGKCTDLRIVPDVLKGQQISLSITLNPVIPLYFSWERVAFLFFLSCLVYALRPSSFLHQTEYIRLKPAYRKILLALFFMMHLLFFRYLTGLNPYFQTEEQVNQRQYQELAESLRAGSFALLEEPARALQEMENPYDLLYRNQVMSEAGEWYNWDHAYYKGKYYVYFGGVPAILFYLPYYVITGTHLHNHVLIFFLSLFFTAGCMGVVHEMIRKWFPRTSLGVWILLNELLLLGSGIIYMTKRPDLYTVPILSGLAFGMPGLWCFLIAGRGKEISLKYLGLGSLFTAFIAGCRPQLFLLMLPAAVLLWESAVHPLAKSVTGIGKDGGGKRAGEGKDESGRKKADSQVLSAITVFALPMLLVAAGLMYYNYSRFESVFDFGANYNLTMNDMRNRGFRLDRIPLGILAYLFQPVKIIQRFPFMEAVYLDSQYMGVTIQEATYGGIFMTNLFTWFSLLPLLFRRHFKKHGRTPCRFALACLLAAAIIIVADTNMSGILQRYFGDFSVFLMLASTTAVLLVLERLSVRGSGREFFKRMVLWGLLICLLWQIGYQGMAFFLDTGESLQELRPDLYAHVKYLVNFWV